MSLRQKPALVVLICGSFAASCNEADFSSNSAARAASTQAPHTSPAPSEDDSKAPAIQADSSINSPGITVDDKQQSVKAKPTPSPILSDGEQAARYPGTQVARVGIDFEDSDRDKDFDSLDVLVCLQGGFKINGSAFVAFKDQTLNIGSHLVGGPACQHQVSIVATAPDGSKSPLTFNTDWSDKQLTLAVKAGSQIEVTMTSSGDNCGAPRNQHQSCPYAQILGDNCPPNTGNVPCQ